MLAHSIFHVATEVADAWLVGSNGGLFDYAYGGTRMVLPQTPYAEVETELLRLMRYESHLKNVMINLALEEGALEHLRDRLPSCFLGSRVAGGRCLFRPHDDELYRIMSNPGHPYFRDTARTLFSSVATVLNEQEGRIKLTPDFGKFSGVSDILREFTPHVLGIRRENGGCAGKASYTTTGILAALKHLDVGRYRNRPVTVIGADGALGIGIAAYFAANDFRDLKVADLSYRASAVVLDTGSGGAAVPVLRSERGKFTHECLERGDLIVASTWGDELVNSDLASIPRSTLLVLAHNNALPPGAQGRAVVEELKSRGVTVIPGQVLTLGGALTTRLEWYSRQEGQTEFQKPLAHQVVATVTPHLLRRLVNGLDGSKTCHSETCDFFDLYESCDASA